MDAIITYGGKAVFYGLGFRAAYRGLRTVHWRDTDRWDQQRTAADIAAATAAGAGANRLARLAAEGAARIAARNIEREKIRREWGGIWARGLPVQNADNLIDRLRAGEQFNIMGGGHSYKELMIYNQFSAELILDAAEEMIRSIQAGGIAGGGGSSAYARLYARINDPDPKIRLEAQLSIIKMCTSNQYRADRSQNFMRKIEWSKKATDKLEGVRAWKAYMQIMCEIYKDSAQKFKDIYDFLMKILRALA